MKTALERFLDTLEENRCAVFFSEISRRFLSGFPASDGVLFVSHAECVLYLDSRYYEMGCIAASRGQIPPQIRIEEAVFFRDFAQRLEKGAVREVFFEDLALTVSELSSLQKRFPKAEWLPMGERCTLLRAVKTPEEIEKIRAAQSLAESAYTHLLSVLSPKMTETEVAAELEYYMKKNGASAPSFETIAISGTRTSLPHGRPENRLLENNAFLTLDFGALLDGYCADMTRTVCLGKASDEMKKVYETVLSAHLAAFARIRAGVTGAFVDDGARSVIKEAGYGEYFGHSTGHGIGLEVHEAPSFSPRATESIIPAGAVLSVEPGIYLPGKFGVRIENLAVVLPDGAEDLNKTSRALLEIC